MWIDFFTSAGGIGYDQLMGWLCAFAAAVGMVEHGRLFCCFLGEKAEALKFEQIRMLDFLFSKEF